MPNIFLGVSGHGYGHLSQIIPIANEMLKSVPDLKYFIQCDLPTSVIAERLNTNNFVHIRDALDVGLIQPNPLEVDIESSLSAYKEFHQNYDKMAEKLASYFSESQIEIVLADIPYLAIEAASRASIPVIAVASLSWDKIIQSYFSKDEQAGAIINQIRETQSKCDLALHPVPSMNLDSFTNSQSIPPILLQGKKVEKLREKLRISEHDKRKIVLVSLGGIEANNIPVKALSSDSRFHWLVNIDLNDISDNVHSTHSIQEYCYRDLIASIDAVVSKPGYGTAAEVIHYQLPFLFTCRGDFPDEPFIVAWLESYGRCKQIDKSEWLSGNFGDYLVELIKELPKNKVTCNGAEVAAKIILDNYLSI